MTFPDDPAPKLNALHDGPSAVRSQWATPNHPNLIVKGGREERTKQETKLPFERPARDGNRFASATCVPLRAHRSSRKPWAKILDLPCSTRKAGGLFGAEKRKVKTGQTTDANEDGWRIILPSAVNQNDTPLHSLRGVPVLHGISRRRRSRAGQATTMPEGLKVSRRAFTRATEGIKFLGQ